VTKPKIVVIVLVIAVVASVLAVTTGFQGVMASYITGYGTEVSDTDIAEVTEATEVENVTMAGAANQTVNRETTGVEFLVIQNAQSGSISQVNATTYTLELTNVSDKTILFSDRPDRIVTSISTSDFISNWTRGQDSFSVDPPNAALVVDDLQGKQDEIIGELFNPVYEQDSKMLKYNLVLLNDTRPTDFSNFEASTLIIDYAITQVGDSISNVINQANTMKNNLNTN
jgi:hypothetical protein